MPPSRVVRTLAASICGALVVAALAGCDPIAWARRTPADGPGVSAPVDVAALAGGSVCDDPDTVGGTGRTVPYSALHPSDGFTAAVARARGRVVKLGARTVAFHDFTPSTDHVESVAVTIDGGVLGRSAAGLIGAGATRTTLEVGEGTSTRSGDIPIAFPATNQLDVLRVRGDDDVLRGFTVRGTLQGHPYNGLRIDQGRELRASDIRVVGIPGDDVQPPGETFGINDYRTTGSVWSDVEVDGDGVGASGFGVNGSRQITLCRVSSHDNRVAMGFAFWQTNGIRMVDCTADDNGFSGFNFERVSGSTVLVRPSASGNRYDMRIATDRTSGRYTIIDPVMADGHWTVTMPRTWYGTTNKQRRADVTLIVDGRSRPDLLRFATY